MKEKRFYYKTTDGKAWYSLKSPEYKGKEGYVELTEEEWNTHIAELEAKRHRQ